jgi:hypothetical protein
MRKIKLLSFALFLFTTVIKAQFNKGSLLLGADLSFSTQNFTSGTAESEGNGFGISPIIAVATKQNTFWGGSLNYSHSKSISGNPINDQKSNNYGGGVFVRKYKPVVGKVYAFVQAGVFAGSAKSKSSSGADFRSELKTFGTSLNVTPGVSVAVSKKIYLEAGFSNIASINYQHSKGTNYNFGSASQFESNNFSFSSSLGSFSNNLYFGFRFIIPKG